jgi:hypothetical protein
MLFLDGQKFSLDAEDLQELQSVFPDYIKKNTPIRIIANENTTRRVETNDPRNPFVYTKPKYGMFLVHNYIDNETGEQHEIRFSDGAPQIMADGRKVFFAKHRNIEAGMSFSSKEKELLWFAYNFSSLFSNSKKARHNAPFKFHMPEKEATAHASREVNKAKAILAVSSLSKDELFNFTKKTLGASGNESRDILLSRIVSRINKDVEFEKYVIDELTPNNIDSAMIDLLDKAINLEVLMPSTDGTQTILAANGKEITFADIPFEDKESLIEFLSKDKKSLNILKKAMA